MRGRRIVMLTARIAGDAALLAIGRIWRGIFLVLSWLLEFLDMRLLP